MRNYEPFAYPPSFDLARLHQQAFMPGRVASKEPAKCPCCEEPVKKEFSSWVGRSIEADFKKFGGSVVTYFWLVHLYAWMSALIAVVYSVYLITCVHQYCSYA